MPKLIYRQCPVEAEKFTGHCKADAEKMSTKVTAIAMPMSKVPPVNAASLPVVFIAVAGSIPRK